jgi:hypothetical protein
LVAEAGSAAVEGLAVEAAVEGLAVLAGAAPAVVVPTEAGNFQIFYGGFLEWKPKEKRTV